MQFSCKKIVRAYKRKENQRNEGHHHITCPPSVRYTISSETYLTTALMQTLVNVRLQDLNISKCCVNKCYYCTASIQIGLGKNMHILDI